MGIVMPTSSTPHLRTETRRVPVSTLLNAADAIAMLIREPLPNGEKLTVAMRAADALREAAQ